MQLHLTKNTVYERVNVKISFFLLLICIKNFGG
jgi:hypothetical protein